MIGPRLDSYEIVAPLGAGEWVRSIVLGTPGSVVMSPSRYWPGEFVADRERLRRFEQEARAVAARRRAGCSRP
jgi:hypothetical protein